ncbi:CUB and peptidase domain-containing protein 2-like [Cloeon dipterum]|uniref:CUB and peptidase domain-containing protein 2-like n=1 Tax=Cloeon dipterum TaxID=197152 RepID=UPI00321FE95A
MTKNVKGQSNCNTVLNNYELEYLKYNKIPMQNILCVEESRFYYNYLINFYNGRYFLRGLRHIWDYRVYIDILPYIDEITRHAKDVYALRPIPQTKQPKGYDTPYNFSFPACGWKMTLTRTRRYGGPYFARGGLIARHEFPWHVFIEKEQVKEYICGGTLISPTAVLTAAHCIYGSEAEEFRVSIGLYDKRERTAYSVQTRKLSSLIVHPKYNPPEFYSDVGIMILNEKINITDQVRPICLWNEDSNLARVAGTEAVAVGFGLDDNYARPDELQEVRLPIRDHKECYLSNRKFFGKYLVPGDNFCAGYMNGITTCNGDSGGSLSVEKDGRWFIRGIVSFGKSKKVISEEGEERSLCDVNQYTLFADVASYVDWIVENTPEISFRN